MNPCLLARIRNYADLEARNSSTKASIRDLITSTKTANTEIPRMAIFEVHGGRKLKGDIIPQGAKNEALGAKFTFHEDKEYFEVEGKNLHGSYMLLDEASVTGTANIVMAAVLAEGESTIYNAACEPYLQQLCRMLTAMGAKITGIGSN